MCARRRARYSDSRLTIWELGVTYTASVGVGSPAVQYTLLIDTGSSNTWVGADKKYSPSSTAKSTGAKVVRIPIRMRIPIQPLGLTVRDNDYRT